MTLSFWNCSADGGMIDRPAGGLFLDVEGVFRPPPKAMCSELLVPSGSMGFAVFCSLDSMICLCWSRTEMLLCSCSRIVGSWVWKPGDRHAKPTSCIARPPLSLAVKGAEGRDDTAPCPDEVLDDRSNFRGLCLEVAGTSGEPGGSFFTIIFGGPCRDLYVV